MAEEHHMTCFLVVNYQENQFLDYGCHDGDLTSCTDITPCHVYTHVHTHLEKVKYNVNDSLIWLIIQY